MKSAKGVKSGAAMWGFERCVVIGGIEHDGDYFSIFRGTEYFQVVVEFNGETFKSSHCEDPFDCLDECEHSPLGKKAFKARHGFTPSPLTEVVSLQKHSIDIEA